MALHVFRLDLRDGGPDVGHAGVGDDDVDMVDALVLEGLDGVEGVLPDGSVDLDHDQLGALGRRELGERLGGRVVRVAVGRDDRVVRQPQVALQQALAYAPVRSGNQHDGRHDGIILIGGFVIALDLVRARRDRR